MGQDEFRIKIRLCKHLNVRSVFAVRMLPRPCVIELVSVGGYALILKYQLYSWTHAPLAKRVAHRDDGNRLIARADEKS